MTEKYQMSNIKCQISNLRNWVLDIGNYLKLDIGYTLVELMLYMGLFVILLGVLLQIFSSTLDTQLGSQANSSVQIDGRYLLARFAYDIERAQSITVPAQPGNSGSTLTLVIGGSNYSYTTSGGDLQLTTGGSNNNLNNYNTTVSGLNFLRLGNAGGINTITISFTLTSKTTTNSGSETRTFQTTVGTR